jgi:hypothetical protein
VAGDILDSMRWSTAMVQTPEYYRQVGDQDPSLTLR